MPVERSPMTTLRHEEEVTLPTTTTRGPFVGKAFSVGVAYNPGGKATQQDVVVVDDPNWESEEEKGGEETGGLGPEVQDIAQGGQSPQVEALAGATDDDATAAKAAAAVAAVAAAPPSELAPAAAVEEEEGEEEEEEEGFSAVALGDGHGAFGHDVAMYCLEVKI